MSIKNDTYECKRRMLFGENFLNHIFINNIYNKIN